MSLDTQSSSKNAVGFLKAFRVSGPINIVAIHPVSGFVTAITRPVSHPDISAFINKHNGSQNLYFMVNTPKENAPDNKLKKDQVEFINAVWLDADPVKSKPFDQERKRLLGFSASLEKSQNPPTYIIDSGGGVQAFWVLETPVPATPDNVKLYEAYSRGLAEQHGTDKVQNIDRIMRIPCTWNLPTAKKKGREKALSKVIHAASKEGVRYE